MMTSLGMLEALDMTVGPAVFPTLFHVVDIKPPPYIIYIVCIENAGAVKPFPSPCEKISLYARNRPVWTSII